MLNNLINRHDADRLLRKVRKLDLDPVLAKLRVRAAACLLYTSPSPRD